MYPTFKDIKHEQFYEGNIRMTHSQQDPYRKALFYLLGLTPQTRQHIQDIYDYEESCIRLEGLEQGWQTSSSIKLTRLAFNLFNGYTGDSEADRDYSRNYSPYHLFDTSLMPYFFEALKLRYAEYAHTLQQPFLPFSPIHADHSEEYEMES
ncbi:DUF6075 family protein [Paenibacillus sp. S150]|uniref:DUF6075 family protein n=1 Tax=Paenibacillus sp. S150 TaxID=2749826 RepID=UPI001C56F3B1|nr:DUF6075 family protein [Paenibacillus sp. S150]MBW4080259.1 hypothetical protein [Paenibacillus sp. S150]